MIYADKIEAALTAMAGAAATAGVTKIIASWKSRRDLKAAAASSKAEEKKADADYVSSLSAAFERLTNELQEELVQLRTERAAWTRERHDLRDEVAKLKGAVAGLIKQMKAAGLQPEPEFDA